MIRAIILDIDGTLLDSNDAHAQAWVECFAEEGLNIPFEKIRPLIGMGGDLLVPEVTKSIAADSPQGERLRKRHGEIFRAKYLRDLRPFPDARNLLEHFKQEGLKLVVGSSADSSMLQDLLKQAGVEDLIEDAAERDEDETSKPAPDLVEKALKIAGVAPDEAVMVGDTVYDIVAAKRAGVKTIALTCGGSDPSDLKGAAAIHRDPTDLLAHLTRSRTPELQL